MLWTQFPLKMQVCPLPCSQNIFFILSLAFLSLWVKRNFRGWGALGLTCRIDSFAWTICSRSTWAKRLPRHRSDGNAVCVWPWLFQVSGIFSFFFWMCSTTRLYVQLYQSAFTYYLQMERFKDSVTFGHITVFSIVAQTWMSRQSEMLLCVW